MQELCCPDALILHYISPFVGNEKYKKAAHQKDVTVISGTENAFKSLHPEQNKALSHTQWNDFKAACGPSSAPPRYLIRKSGLGGASGLN